MPVSFHPAVILLVLILILISSIGLWFVLYQIIKQQGRILLHLDNVEQSLANGVVTKGAQRGCGWQALSNQEKK